MICPTTMHYHLPSKKHKSFALAATTLMTAITLGMAASMLSVRSQWKVYASRSAEKIMLEASAQAETQDFMNRVERKLKAMSSSDPSVAGNLGEADLFNSDPFRRVEIRGGIGKTSSGKLPLMFSQIDETGIATTVSEQSNSPSEERSIKIPALWSPKDPTEPAGSAKNPSKLALGKDDPFFDIDCRTSFAAVSAYSTPRRSVSVGRGGGNPSGFGNVVVAQTRTFPVSAFTSIQFDPDTPMVYAPAPIGDEGWDVKNFNAGTIYTPGTVEFATPSTASRVVALKGIKSAFSSAPPPIRPSEEAASMSSANEAAENTEVNENEVGQITYLYDRKIEESKYVAERKIGSLMSERDAKIAAISDDDDGEGEGDEGDNNTPSPNNSPSYYTSSSQNGGTSVSLATQISKIEEEYKKKIAEEEFKRDREIAGLVAEKASLLYKKGLASAVSSSKQSSNDPSRPAELSDSGGREKGKGVVLGRFGQVSPSDNDSSVVASLDSFGDVWNKDRVGAFRGMIVSSDNGGTELIRNNATAQIGTLIDEMSKFVDCKITFELGPEDPVTFLRSPAIANNGLQMRVDTLKPLVSPPLWIGDSEASGAPFYTIKNEGNQPGGILVFDPSKLTFAPPASGESNVRPFSILINQSALAPSGQMPWYLFVKGGGSPEGITIVSPQQMFVYGNFNSAGLPSMLVSPSITPVIGPNISSSTPVLVKATVVTSAPNPLALFEKASWPAYPDPRWRYPVSPSMVIVEGSSVSWNTSARSVADSVWTVPVAPPVPVLMGESAPSLAPVVGEVRVSAAAHGTKKVALTGSNPTY